MLVNNYRINDYTFFDIVDPDDSVHNSLDYTCDNGDYFENTDTSRLFFCSYGGGNPQVWNKIAYTSDIAAIPQADWSQSNVSSSDYIKNKPSIPSAQIQSDWTQASSGSLDFIKNKPTIPAAQIQSDWNQTNSSSLDFIKNKPAVAAARSQSAQTRTLNSIFQVSSTRDSLVNYSVDIATTLSLTTGQSGTVYLEIASDSGFTTNVQEISRAANGQTGTLTIGLGLNQNVTGSLNGYVPVGYYARLRTQNNTGTPTFTYRSGQEVLL